MNSTPNLAGFHLTFDDEFNLFTSSATGSSKWGTAFPWGSRILNPGEVGYYNDSSTGVGVNPFSVSGGVLTIKALPGSYPDGKTYGSGLIQSDGMFSQTYGYFEMRAELPQGAGMWSGFWLVPVSMTWPPELDVMEAYGAIALDNNGGPYFYSIATHSAIGSSDTIQHVWVPTPNTQTGYHTYGVDWERNVTTFYFDGQEVDQVPTPTDMNVPMYIIASLAVGGSAGAPSGETSQFKIDYIRAFAGSGTNLAVVQQPISSPDGGGKTFYGAIDANGNGAAGGGTVPPIVAPLVGDTLVLNISEDAYQGDAQFTISIDGKQIGGTQTATASHAQGATTTLRLSGTWGSGSHIIGISFINDAYKSVTADRNLYVNSILYDGRATPNAPMAMDSNSIVNFTMPAAIATDTLTLHLSEDAFKGDAQFSTSIDGINSGLVQSVAASHLLGQTQAFTFKDILANGLHDVAVSFLNDLYAGTPSTDRNLYVQGLDLNGKTVPGSSGVLMGDGSFHIRFVQPA